MLPVFRWKVVECSGPVLDPLGISLVPFRSTDLDEEIERDFGFGAGPCLPDVVQMALGLGLKGIWHRIQGVHGFMNPAASFPRQICVANRPPAARQRMFTCARGGQRVAGLESCFRPQRL